jgi:hypothetical protein
MQTRLGTGRLDNLSNSQLSAELPKLVNLYGPLTMHKVHQKLDTAVEAAYQPSGCKKTYTTDAERLAFLFDLYQRITSLLPSPAVK